MKIFEIFSLFKPLDRQEAYSAIERIVSMMEHYRDVHEHIPDSDEQANNRFSDTEFDLEDDRDKVFDELEAIEKSLVVGIDLFCKKFSRHLPQTCKQLELVKKSTNYNGGFWFEGSSAGNDLRMNFQDLNGNTGSLNIARRLKSALTQDLH